MQRGRGLCEAEHEIRTLWSDKFVKYCTLILCLEVEEGDLLAFLQPSRPNLNLPLHDSLASAPSSAVLLWLPFRPPTQDAEPLFCLVQEVQTGQYIRACLSVSSIASGLLGASLLYPSV